MSMGLPSGARSRLTLTDAEPTGAAAGSLPRQADTEIAAITRAAAAAQTDLWCMCVLTSEKFPVRAMIVQLPHLPQSVRVPREPAPTLHQRTRTVCTGRRCPQKRWE